MASPARLFRLAARRLARPTRLLSTSVSYLKSPPSANAELGVGEMEGITFKIAPLKRTGEDETTMRARLLYQSRKRGMREGELLLSTFAATQLPRMSVEQMQIYDRFLDENDWDIYYWATQVETGPGPSGKGSELFEPKPAQGEWAQTIGAFRPAYRPIPSRWQGSEMLAMLRNHVERQKKPEEGKQGGMAFVPELPSQRA